MLLVLAGVKLVMTCLILVCGWKGGYIFPIMFVGIVLGLAVNLIFPQIPVAVAVAATIAGVIVNHAGTALCDLLHRHPGSA